MPENANLDKIGRILEDAVTTGRVPGVVAGVGQGPSTLGSWAAGYADTTPGARRPMRKDTVFDLASLTKPVATTTLTLALAARGQLALDDPVSLYLPVTWEATVRHLLTHSSGLPAIATFFDRCANRGEVLRDLYATPLEAPPGTRVAYSDLGFMALGEIVATVSGEPLDVLFRQLVAAPLGMPDTGYIPLPAGPAGTLEPHSPVSPAPVSPAAVVPPEPPQSPPAAVVPPEPPQSPRIARFAATERRDDGTPWTGVVHDENARAMGGVAGHAGLFATLSDLTRFAAWWVSPDDGPVPAALRREAETCQTLRLDGRRGLGWTCIGDRYDILGEAWPATAVSHTGFTGTSLALDSASGVWVVLLTNRVHFGREASAAAIKSLRRDVHAAAAPPR